MAWKVQPIDSTCLLSTVNDLGVYPVYQLQLAATAAPAQPMQHQPVRQMKANMRPASLLLLLLACAIAFSTAQELTAGSVVSVPVTIVTEVPLPEAAEAAAAAEASPVIDPAAVAAAIETMAAAARAIPPEAPETLPDNVINEIDISGAGVVRVRDPPAIRPSKAKPTHYSTLYSYVYAWCGLAPTDNPPADTRDYVAVIDANPNSATFGKIVYNVSTPYSWTEPHHAHVDKSGKWFGAGGLLAFLQGAPDIYMFDTTNPAKPKYSHGLTLSVGGCPDEFRAMSTGGFAVSSMCARTGGVGGGWLKIAGSKMNVMTQYQLPASQSRSSYNPHGIDVDEVYDRVLTSDFFDVASTIVTDMNNPPTIRLHTTMRVWKYSTGAFLGTIKIPDGYGAGMMDTRRVPNAAAQFWVTNGLGQFYWVDALAMKAQRAYCVMPNCEYKPGNCINSNTFANGKRMLLAVFALSQLRLLDVSNPKAPKTLDIYQMPAGAGGHSIKYDDNTGMAALSTYFLDIRYPALKLNTTLVYNSDRKIWLFKIDLSRDKIIFKSNVDFNTAMPNKGPSNCHGLAFNSGYQY